MKFWKVEKGSGFNVTYYLCGYPIYKEIDKLNLRERIFCSGLISSKKVTDHYKGLRLKDCFILGQRILQYGSYDYIFIFKLLGLTLYSKEVSMLFYNKYKSKIPPETDYLCFLATGIGEFSLFLSLCLKNFMKQNNIKHPLFITKAKHNIALLNIFFPTAKILYIQGFPFQRMGEFNVNNIRARYFFPIPYFQQVEEDITNKKAHFFDSILNYLNLEPNNFDVNLPKIAEEYKHSAEEKLKSMGLLDKKFIFIAPEANSCENVNKKFWGKLTKKLHDKGFEIIFNSAKMPLSAQYFIADFSLQEVFIVAQKAQAVIGLRSGLLDLLSMTGVPIHAIYTAFKNRKDFPPMSKENVKIGFDLEKLPAEIKKSKIYSYFYRDNLADDILEKI